MFALAPQSIAPQLTETKSRIEKRSYTDAFSAEDFRITNCASCDCFIRAVYPLNAHATHYRSDRNFPETLYVSALDHEDELFYCSLDCKYKNLLSPLGSPMSLSNSPVSKNDYLQFPIFSSDEEDIDH